MKTWNVRYKDAGRRRNTIVFQAASHKAAIRGLRAAVVARWQERTRYDASLPGDYEPVTVLRVRSNKS